MATSYLAIVLTAVTTLCFLGAEFTEAAHTFWQITDVHFDRDYNATAGDINNMCHVTNSTNTGPPGTFGNFSCDSPWTLVESAIQCMAQEDPHPDFILWTGDNAPHVDSVDWNQILDSISNITSIFLEKFGSEVPVIPVLGNHDVSPPNQYPDKNETLYKQYLEKRVWGSFINEVHQVETFKKGGYYSKFIQTGIKVIVLNTNLYEYANNLVKNTTEDPSDQFSWLEQELIAAEQNKSKVILTAHIPPGYFGGNPIMPFMKERLLTRYLDIVIKYSNVIISHIYGHTHTDDFKLITNNTGFPVGSGLIAPSIAPNGFSYKRGVNPSLRLYKYDPVEGLILDYDQYFLNLTEVNRNVSEIQQLVSTTSSPSTTFTSLQPDITTISPIDNSKTEEEEGLMNEADDEDIHVPGDTGSMNIMKRSLLTSQWKLLYSASATYNLTDLSAHSMTKLYFDLIQNNRTFQQYYKYNKAGVVLGSCDATCTKQFICPVIMLHENDLEKCMNAADYNSKLSKELDKILAEWTQLTPSPSISPPKEPMKPAGNPNAYIVPLLVCFCILAVVILAATALVCVRRHRRLHQGTRRLFSVSADEDLQFGYNTL